MLVSTLVRRSSALIAIVGIATACSDAPMAPRATPERPAFDIQALQPTDARGGPGGHELSQTDSNITVFTIDPNASRTYAFGQNWIYFPAHSICDPATSGYGMGLWDTPCTPLAQPIDVTVRWSSRGGYAFAVFSPEIRFVPADARHASRWVVLSLHSQKRLHDLDAYNILYNAGNNSWVDESLTDPTLRAWLDPLHNSVVRRVKHFSGYMIAGGYTGGLGDASY
jgi:hypothetical protein